jgi:hypothetical protein
MRSASPPSLLHPPPLNPRHPSSPFCPLQLSSLDGERLALVDAAGATPHARCARLCGLALLCPAMPRYAPPRPAAPHYADKPCLAPPRPAAPGNAG